MDREASSGHHVLASKLLDECTEPTTIPFSFLDEITNGFSDDLEIGRGRFAVVYKGTLGDSTIAVKKLSNMYMNEENFYQYVGCLVKLKNKNVVRFLGYCADSDQRLLCFEYLSKGSLDVFLTGDVLLGLKWTECYRIMRGICEGLHFIHQNNAVHFDFKPSNILFNDDMIPKIVDLGFTRCLDEIKNESIISKLNRSIGYFAPEQSGGRAVTIESNIYSLGLIILEIIMGEKRSSDRDARIVKWSNVMDGLKKHREYDQILACDEMASECCNIKPAKRPSTRQIIDRLDEIKSVEWRPDMHSETLVKECRTPKDSDEIDYQVCEIEGVTVVPTYHYNTPEVHPMHLRFPSEPGELMPCLLHVTNSTSSGVLFRLMEGGKASGCFLKLPMEGIFPPYCTYTLVVFTTYQKIQPDIKEINLILRSVEVGDRVMHSNDRDSYLTGKYSGIIVQEKKVTLKDLSAQQEHITYQVLFVKKFYVDLQSIDIDPTRQWIITGHGKSEVVDRVRIWNYHTQRLVDSFRVKPGKGVRYIAREQLFLIFGHSEGIYVYKYDTKEQVDARHIDIGKKDKSLAVHPTKPYVFLPDYTADRIILQTWDDNNLDIERLHTKWGNNTETKITLFNPEDNNSLVTASSDNIVKAWSVDSGTCKYTLPGEFFFLSSLYFFTRDGQQYLLIGSLVGSVEIWDMQEITRVGKLEGLNSSVHSVSAHPSMPVLLTGSEDGAVHLWSSTDYRLQGVIQIGNSGCVKGIICLTGSTRVLIGQEDAITMIDIRSMNCTEKSMNSCEPKTRSTTSEHIISSSNVLLDVYPLELIFAFDPNKSTSCLLHLTNKTDAHVAFSLRDKSGADSRFFQNLPQGVVDPRCTKTLSVEKGKEACFSEETCFDLVLRSSIYWDKLFLPYDKKSLPCYFFEETKELGHAVHDVTLKAVCSPISENTYEEIEGSEFEVPILDVSPLELQFILGRQEPITCSLHLINKTDECAAFRLVSKSKNYYQQYLAKVPLCGIVPSRSTYTLILKLGEQTTKLGIGKDQDLVLQSCILGDKYVLPLTKLSIVDDILEEAIKMGHAVHKVSPKALITPNVLPEEQPASEIVSTKNSPYSICCLDAHPTEPWIITGHDDGTCSIWKHGSQMEQLVRPFKVSEKQVCSVKFIARKQWILAGTTKGYINVYNCACVTDVKKIRAFFAHADRFRSLSVHPIQPYLLSVSDSIIKLWDMDNDCQLTKELKEPSDGPAAFHPKDASSFATTSGSKVKVWRTEDLKPSYSLSPRKSRVKCLDFFTRDGVQYLITGLEDSTAKIWDLQKKKCIHTMEDIMSPVISVISLPGRPYLVTGSKDGFVHVWSSIDFRLQETVHFAGGGPVVHLAYLRGSRSIVVGQKRTISIINIHNKEVIIDDKEVIIDEEEKIIGDEEDIIDNKELIIGYEEAAESQKNSSIDDKKIITSDVGNIMNGKEVIIDHEEAVESQNNSTISHQNYRTARTGTSTTHKGSRFMAKVRKILKICKT